MLLPNLKYVLNEITNLLSIVLYFAEFEDLNIKDNAFYQNVLSIGHFIQKKWLKAYLKGPIRGVETGIMSHYPFLTNTNAFYDPATNKITIPIGAMQPPLFWTTPKSLTFGGIDFVIGMCEN